MILLMLIGSNVSFFIDKKKYFVAINKITGSFRYSARNAIN